MENSKGVQSVSYSGSISKDQKKLRKFCLEQAVLNSCGDTYSSTLKAAKKFYEFVIGIDSSTNEN